MNGNIEITTLIHISECKIYVPFVAISEFESELRGNELSADFPESCIHVNRWECAPYHFNMIHLNPIEKK